MQLPELGKENSCLEKQKSVGRGKEIMGENKGLRSRMVRHRGSSVRVKPRSRDCPLGAPRFAHSCLIASADCSSLLLTVTALLSVSKRDPHG